MARKRKRAAGERKDATYLVGYGRTPMNTRFRPGRSGNPRGRPKGVRNVETILREELFAPVIIVEKGRRKKVARFTALLRRLMEKGFAGDARSAFRLIELAMRLTSDRPDSSPGLDLSPEDTDLLDLLAARSERIKRRSLDGQTEGEGDGEEERKAKRKDQGEGEDGEREDA